MEKTWEGYDLQEATVDEHIVAGQRLLKQQQPLAAQQCFEAASRALIDTYQHRMWQIITDALGPHEEVTKRIGQDIFITAHRRFPAFRSGHSVWAWLESIAQEHITHTQAKLTELTKAWQEVRPFCRAAWQDDGPDIAQNVFLVAFGKLPEIPDGPGLRQWLRGIAMRISMQGQRQEGNRSRLRQENQITIRNTTHVQETPSPARWLEIQSWWGGKPWSKTEQDWLEKVLLDDWTRTEVALDYLINCPRTPRRLQHLLEAIQRDLVEADCKKDHPTLSDKAQKHRAASELDRMGASPAALRLWEQTWRRVSKCVEASATQHQRERADETWKFL